MVCDVNGAEIRPMDKELRPLRLGLALPQPPVNLISSANPGLLHRRAETLGRFSVWREIRSGVRCGGAEFRVADCCGRRQVSAVSLSVRGVPPPVTSPGITFQKSYIYI